ncbi:hypothetical protein HAX54_021043 [Datura stramonium]|uniref:Brix domain-containing protein n=1 Tax=Datura stramonium TaxID=4076 RepID=A0ABS8UTZ3_DATST|nr:hypothetical protein [Datura stramonium]
MLSPESFLLKTLIFVPLYLLAYLRSTMGRKRKHVETEAAAKDETAIERPKRTLLGFKRVSTEENKESSVSAFNVEPGVPLPHLPEGKDLYLSKMANTPIVPSVKFLVNAVHTMEELKLTGNHLKGSRPILTFSSNFDRQPHWKLLKEMFIQIFGTPKDHRKS